MSKIKIILLLIGYLLFYFCNLLFAKQLNAVNKIPSEQGQITSVYSIDAQLFKINTPVRTPMRNTTISPNVTIKNAGTNPISNIPVFFWIDSAGHRIYNQSQTYAGTLNPNDTANITFSPNFNIGGPGASYGITAFTNLPGDSNHTNDTLKQVAYLRGLIWQELPINQAVRYRCGGCGDTMGHFYTYGGYRTTYESRLFRYDVRSRTWTQLADIPVAVMNITGTYDLARNRIYVPGGYSPYRNFLQIYYVDEDSWGLGAPMPMVTSGTPCAIIGDTLWVVTSVPTAGSLLGYDINNDSWFFRASRPNCASYSRLVAYNGELYSSGGWPEDNTFYKYTPAADTWIRLPDFPEGRHSHGMVVFHNWIVVYGGCRNWYPSYDDVYVMDMTLPTLEWVLDNPMLQSGYFDAFGAVTTDGKTQIHAYSGLFHQAGGYPLTHDVGVDTILVCPIVGINDTSIPLAVIKNYGTSTATFNVLMKTEPPINYIDTVTITLPSFATDTASFGRLPPAGVTLKCTTMLLNDQNHYNDAKSVRIAYADYVEKFDSSNGNYVPIPGSGAWQWDSVAGYWVTGISGYQPNANWKLNSVNFYALVDTPVLAYRHWYEIESYGDGYNVKYSTDNGTTWNLVHALPGYGQPYDQIVSSTNSGIPGESAYSRLDRTWRLNWMQIPVLSGDSFIIRWHFGSDQSIIYQGTMIDYVCGIGFDTILPIIHDVAVTEINSPIHEADTLISWPVSATVQSFSNVAESLNLVFNITGPVSFFWSDTVHSLSLNPGESTRVNFDSVHFQEFGTHNTVCYVSPTIPGDTNILNDTARSTVDILYIPVPIWHPLAPIPDIPSGRRPKSGTCMAGLEATGLIYLLKASNRPDFYSYNRSANTWTQLQTIPKGDKELGDGKYPKQGAAMAACANAVYVLRGNNTLGFWKYVADTTGGDTIGWSKLKNFPTSVKRVKNGSGLVKVTKQGTDYLFASRGAKQSEFYLYDIAEDSWIQVTSPPVGASGKYGYKKGSCMASDSEHVYVLQGFYGSFFKYHVESDSWTELNWYDYKEYRNREGKKKKLKDGAALVYLNNWIYMLKGGNTRELWKINVTNDTGSWIQMEPTGVWDIPFGPSNKRVKGGACMIKFGPYFFAAKGANTNEFYRHVRPYETQTLAKSKSISEGTMGKKVKLNRFQLTIAPNPAINVAAVKYSLPVPGPVHIKLYNVTGKLVKSYTITNPTKDGSLLIDAKDLSAGVYILRFNSGAIRITRKLVIER
ncbi:MAG: T9SS type A sorting domain-containing protein [candidate division WOR-3 bacterium]|nr:T9SS type A sorting domain-containing protein [candidate division WOR-3 bacterium]